MKVPIERVECPTVSTLHAFSTLSLSTRTSLTDRAICTSDHARESSRRDAMPRESACSVARRGDRPPAGACPRHGGLYVAAPRSHASSPDRYASARMISLIERAGHLREPRPGDCLGTAQAPP